MKNDELPTRPENNEYDVVVVGYGPTGATLANLLSMHGLSVLVIERAIDVYNLPRAVHFDDETMRVFQAVGIADKLSMKTRVNPGMRFIDDSGEVLLDWPRPDNIGRLGWYSSYRLHQPDLEYLLREQLEKYGNCTIKLGAQLLGFQQEKGFVTVNYQEIDTAQSKVCKAKYVVGCDGANSMVRALMHATVHSSVELPDRYTMEDLGFKERWLVVDLILNQDMPELGDHTLQFCSVDQPMTYCRNPGLRRRWEMALPDALDDEQAQRSKRIWSLLDRWIKPSQATLERTAVYTFRSQLAYHWRRERVFIAGDAAHLTPPFMGQGMCAGIRDASNLAWKLAWCVNNENADALLDSYQQERLAHVREYITLAIQLGGLMNSLDHNRVTTQSTSDKSMSKRMASISPKLGFSALIPECITVDEHVGSMLEQCRFADGVLLDDRVGYRPVLITHQSIQTIPSHGTDLNCALENGDEQRRKRTDVVILSAEDNPELKNILDSLGVYAVLVRPDRYIIASAKSASDAKSLAWLGCLEQTD